MNFVFKATPAHRCYAPSRSFSDQQSAVSFARRAARLHRINYCVYFVQGGLVRIVKRFSAERRVRRWS